MTDKVEHISVITAVSDGHITVAIDPGLKCKGCGVAAMCGSKGERSEMTINIPDSCDFRVGESVRVYAADSSTWRAIILTALLPCFILFCGVMLLLALGVNQSVAAVIGISLIVLYFFVLYLLRGRVVGKLRWSVEKIES